MKKLKVLVYGDINLNIIDGSAIWLTSIINVLSMDERIEIDLLLKRSIRSDEVIRSISNYSKIRKIDPCANTADYGVYLNPEDAANIIAKEDNKNIYDCIILRGFNLCLSATQNSKLRNKLICYITDFEHDINKISNQERENLKFVYDNCRYFCAQTNEAKEAIKNILKLKNDDKFLILYPMIPDYDEIKPDFINKNNRIIYSGKFSKEWFTYEILQSFLKLKKVNDDYKLTVVGNLFRNDLQDLREEIIENFENDSNIDWHKGVSRDISNKLISESDFGIAWRSSKIDNDNSVELSTKMLEYCRAGKPILLNRIKMYENLLGKNYPLFVDSEEEFIEKIKQATNDQLIYKKSAKMVYEAGKKYTFSQAFDRLSKVLWGLKKEKVNIVFAGHDFKFIDKFIEDVDKNDKYSIRIDKWSGHNKHDEKHSKECLEWADIIFCEWGLGNALWYSKNKKIGQKLFVRMHLQERDTPYYKDFEIKNIDRFIAISPYIYEEFVYKMNIPREKMIMIYNYVDTEKYNLAKIDEAKFNLGIVGVCPMRKRLDIAIDLLEELIKEDSRYKLYVKGKRPEEYPWLMKRDEEREYYGNLLSRIENSSIKNNIIFDDHGNDMEKWFRKIGFILSTSDFESFHLAPSEGMASGAVPIIRKWEGSNTIHPKEYLFNTIHEAKQLILSNKVNSSGIKEYVKDNFSTNKIFAEIYNVISDV